MKSRWIGLALLLAGIGAAQAQYKYVGPGGEITYSDMPPPPSAKDVQVKGFSSPLATAGLPYDVQQAVAKFPVTIYTSDSCPVCDQLRGYLKRRGVPFTEKTVSSREDLQVAQRASGDPKDTTLPIINMGSQKLIGFTEGSFGSLLDDAGYPASSKLPAGYVFPAPQPAAPRQADSASANGPGSSGTDAAPPPAALTGNAPPGFKF